MKGPCDEHPITDWGFEQPDTEALLATVRGALNVPKYHAPAGRTKAALAALDAIASELERQGEEIEGLRYGYRDSQARLDRAVGALREITVPLVVDGDYIEEALRLQEIARAALAEIGESA